MRETIASNKTRYRGYKICITVSICDKDHNMHQRHPRRYVGATVYSDDGCYLREFNIRKHVKLEAPEWGPLKRTLIFWKESPIHDPMPLEEQVEKRLNEVADKIDDFEDLKDKAFGDSERKIEVSVNRDEEELSIEMELCESDS